MDKNPVSSKSETDQGISREMQIAACESGFKRAVVELRAIENAIHSEAFQVHDSNYAKGCSYLLEIVTEELEKICNGMFPNEDE